MACYTVGKTTESVGTDITARCPAKGTLVPVLTGFSVTTGATEQWLYLMSPIGLTWTQSFTQSDGTSTKLADTKPAWNPDGTPKEIAADDFVALMSEDSQYPVTKVLGVSGGPDITQDATDAFTFTDDGIFSSLNSSAFEFGDSDGAAGDPTDHAGVHFGSLAIVQGATITNAKVRFKISTTGSGAANTDYTVYVHDSDDAPQPNLYSDISLDLQTETKNGQDLSTADVWVEFDITSGLQSVVNRAGWASGNSVNVYVHLDSIDQTEPVNFVTFYDVGSASPPEIVVTSTAEGISWTAAPDSGGDIPYGAMAYVYGNPKAAGSVHRKIRCPASTTTTVTDLRLQGGIPTQIGKLAPASGRGVPMCLLLTNDTNAATLEWATFEYVDPATLADEGLRKAPQGPAARQFPLAAGEL